MMSENLHWSSIHSIVNGKVFLTEPHDVQSTRAATASNCLLPSKYWSSKHRTKLAKPDMKWTEADDQNLHKNARGLKICLMQLMRLYLLLFPLQWSRGIDHINNYGAVSIIGKLPCSIMTADGWEDPALPSLQLNEVLCDVNIYPVLHLLSNWPSHSTLQFPGSREEAGLHSQQSWK